MSEWLTTGQMIDKLKFGEEAKNDTNDYVAYVGVKGNVRIKNKIGIDDLLFINKEVRNAKWRILPNYVSFDDARKAMEDKKNVYFHPNENEKLSASYSGSLTWFESYTWKELFEGKWTIED